MEDREVSVEEHPRRESHEFKPQVNGDHRIPSTSPQQPPKKRVRYTQPPIWARSVRNKGAFGLANRGPSKLNGKQPTAVFQPQTVPPPSVNAQINGNRQASPAATRSGPQPMDSQHPLLGPWEESIMGKKPYDMMTKLVADFLYTNVVSRSDLGELGSRGVEIEIEAKLGQLIDRETNDRYFLPVLSECILNGNARVGFKSSMTEVCSHSLTK
jgi:polynucleotide 5'-triphosphatase